MSPKKELTQEEVIENIVKTMALTMDLLAPIKEAATGYKANLEAEGWSPTAAETMAMQLHQVFLMKAFGIVQ